MNALGLRRDPVRLAASKAPWSAAWYLAGYLFTGPALFAVALAAVLTGAVLGITLAGIPVLVAAARAHTAAARALLGRQEDPLGEAKEVLRRPGPLKTLIPNEP